MEIRTLERKLATCVLSADANELLFAIKACDRIAERLFLVDLGNAGRVHEAADVARNAIFNLLNTASSFGDCMEAAMAIDELHKGRDSDER